MFAYISLSLLLLLLTYVPCALGTAPSELSRRADRRTGCHQSMNAGHAFIFFYTSTEPDFQFGIETKYTTYYPKTLKSALRLDYLLLGGLTALDECGWQRARAVHSTTWREVGGHRGDIY
jgi:hypothetical protein